jgi:flavin-dependent dehydrogenase
VRIGIVGGGPSGSFFAISALSIPSSTGSKPEIVIFERKDFSKPGPAGCNMCAGILSARTVNGIKALGLRIPEDVIRARIDRYILCFQGIRVVMEKPNEKEEILSIYRGGGPFRGDAKGIKSFDQFLIDEAIGRGAVLIRETVREIEVTRSEAFIRTSNGSWKFDLVVYAGGVNGELPKIKGHRYIPPKTERMIQDEFRNPSFSCSCNPWNSSVHIFFKGIKGLIFAGFVPKGPYINLSIPGHGLKEGSVDKFLDLEVVGRLVEDRTRLCGCRPKAVVSMAEGFYGDRFVAIGDACVSRLYKDGIGSALSLATKAAETAILHGIKARDFEAHYAPLCKRIDRDNKYGRSMFRTWRIMKGCPFLIRAAIRILDMESKVPWEDRILGRVIWGLLTGEESYERIHGLFRSGDFQKVLWANAVLEIVRPSRPSPTVMLRR